MYCSKMFFRCRTFLIFSFLTIQDMCLAGDTFYLDRPGKNLCVNNKDLDCSNQVKSANSKGTCLMKYLNQTSKECSDTGFEGEKFKTEKFGSASLTPFAWVDAGIPFSALNITFTNITWKRLKMRFVNVGSSAVQLCREFLLSDTVDPTSVISFDCLWGNGSNAGQDFQFQYVLTNQKDDQFKFTYLIKFPKETDVERNVAPDKYTFFMMIDKTAFPQLSLKFLVPPSKLNITIENITLLHKEEEPSSPETVAVWKPNMNNQTEGDFVRVGPFDTHSNAGYYYFSIKFYINNVSNHYHESSSPVLQIPGLRFGGRPIIAIVLVITSVIGIIYLTWKKKYRKIVNDAGKHLNILFVYDSSYPLHIENIYKFKQFLEEECYVTTRLDLIDIPQTESMNPWQWYYSAFETADCVLMFASPGEVAEQGLHQDNVYRDLYTYALKLLIVYLRNTHKFTTACVRLPGCSWNTLHPDVKTVDKRFSLPEELEKFFKFLKAGDVKNGSSKLLVALQQTRKAPQFSVKPPEAVLCLPFDAEDFNLDCEPRELLTVKNIALNLDGREGSDSESEGDDNDLDRLNVNKLRL